MRLPDLSTVLLTGLLATAPVLADEIPIEIETDLEGDYFIVDKTGPENRPIVTVKQVDGTYRYFIKREFDCETHRVRYLGEGESQAAMDASEPESTPDMEAISPGSISDQLAGYVCPKPEPEPEPEPEAAAGADAESQAPAQ